VAATLQVRKLTIVAMIAGAPVLCKPAGAGGAFVLFEKGNVLNVPSNRSH